MAEALLKYRNWADPVARIAREGNEYVFEYLPAFSSLGLRPLPGLGEGRPGESHRRPVERGLWEALRSRLPNPAMEGVGEVVRLTSDVSPSDIVEPERDDLDNVLALAPRVLTSPFVLVHP